MTHLWVQMYRPESHSFSQTQKRRDSMYRVLIYFSIGNTNKPCDIARFVSTHYSARVRLMLLSNLNGHLRDIIIAIKLIVNTLSGVSINGDDSFGKRAV